MSGTQSQVISFNEIPYTWLVPGSYMEVRPNYSNNGVFDWPAKGLIVGQMLASGSATPGQVYLLTSVQQAQGLFGMGSQAAEMAWAFLKANPFTQVYIVGVSDALTGVTATGALALGGAVTGSAPLQLTLAGRYIPVSVAATDTLATIQANVIAAINAYADLPLIASTGTGTTVTLTAKHKGTIGNALNLRINYRSADVTPPGLTVTITPMSGGTNDPSLAGVISTISNTWYTDIILPFVDTLFAAELDRRYTAMVKLDAYAYVGLLGTYAGLVTASASLNSRFRSPVGVTNAPQSPWVWAASIGGICAQRTTDDPAKGFQGIVLPGILAPADSDQFYAVEREILLANGICTWNVQADRTVTLEQVVSENKTNSSGVPDTSWRFIKAAKVTARVRYDWITFTSLQYPNNKLADDGSLAAEYDPTIATPSRVKGSWAARSNLYEKNGWTENSAVTAKASVFVRDANDPNRLDAQQQIQIIGNLFVLAGVLEFQS